MKVNRTFNWKLILKYISTSMKVCRSFLRKSIVVDIDESK